MVFENQGSFSEEVEAWYKLSILLNVYITMQLVSLFKKYLSN